MTTGKMNAWKAGLKLGIGVFYELSKFFDPVHTFYWNNFGFMLI